MTSFNNLLTQLTKEIGVLLMLSLFNCRLQNTRLLTTSRISQLEQEDHCRGQKIKKKSYPNLSSFKSAEDAKNVIEISIDK